VKRAIAAVKIPEKEITTHIKDDVLRIDHNRITNSTL
jgi:hypothetical protein